MNVIKESLKEIECMNIVEMTNKISELIQILENDIKLNGISSVKNEKFLIKNLMRYLMEMKELVKEIKRIEKQNKLDGKKKKSHTISFDSNFIRKKNCKCYIYHVKREQFNRK
uniref:Uncharacterized protein n=1 Tax=Brugia malayi TaxID=6279 RepID=A0A912H0Q6_BRUMA